MYGFDTASTLAEESVDPRKNAPRSIIGALTAAFVTGGIFIAALNAIPVQWVVPGVVMLLGIAYYAVRHKHLPSPLLAPGRDDVTDDERARAARV